jgi:hypothetical protein
MSPSRAIVAFEGFVPTVEGVSDRDFVFDKVSPPGTFFDIGLIHILMTSTIDACGKRCRTVASKAVAFALTSSSIPMARRVSSRTHGWVKSCA